jgi:hypothetical protein
MINDAVVFDVSIESGDHYSSLYALGARRSYGLEILLVEVRFEQ